VAGLAEAIHSRTAGNPFFTEEVVQSLVESGQLQGTKGSYRLAKPVEEISVPATVQSLLAARIDRLPEREKQVLQCAAVIGREFSLPILERIVDLAKRELTEARLEAAERSSLSPLSRGGARLRTCDLEVVEQLASGAAPPRGGGASDGGGGCARPTSGRRFWRTTSRKRARR
jgi:predicted ATPase